MWPRINGLIDHRILFIVTLFIGLGRSVSGPGVDLLIGVQLAVHRAHHLFGYYVGYRVARVLDQVSHLWALEI